MYERSVLPALVSLESVRGRLLVVGRDDGTGASLRRTAESLGLQRCVMWLGERTDVEQLFDAADIAVLPSHEEGFSNSLIEAMSPGASGSGYRGRGKLGCDCS
jgi:glycosyltransferase involved in cell wall biosynthesis